MAWWSKDVLLSFFSFEIRALENGSSVLSHTPSILSLSPSLIYRCTFVSLLLCHLLIINSKTSITRYEIALSAEATYNSTYQLGPYFIISINLDKNNNNESQPHIKFTIVMFDKLSLRFI